MHFVGADIRSIKYLDWKSEHFSDFLSGKKGHRITESYQDRLIADAREYADFILVSTPDLLRIIPEAIYFPVVLDLKSFLGNTEGEISKVEERHNKNGKIVLLHAPSGLKTKGSVHIHEVLDLLKTEFGDQIEIVTPGKKSGKDYSYSLTRYELIDLMCVADIVIDQMVVGWYGLKTVEALALGCEVVCYIEDSLQAFLFSESPIISANIYTLKNKLTSLINDLIDQKPSRIRHLEWVRKYHTLENNNEPLLKTWLGEK